MPSSIQIYRTYKPFTANTEEFILLSRTIIVHILHQQNSFLNHHWTSTNMFCGVFHKVHVLFSRKDLKVIFFYFSTSSLKMLTSCIKMCIMRGMVTVINCSCLEHYFKNTFSPLGDRNSMFLSCMSPTKIQLWKTQEMEKDWQDTKTRGDGVSKCFMM